MEMLNACILIMNLLSALLPDSSKLVLKTYSLDRTEGQMVVTVASTQQVALCPVCQSPTSRVHSHYQRTLKDLPLVQFSLTLLLEVCKFFCPNEDCHRCIFTERLPSIVAPWARRTERYSQHLQAMSLELGGSASARLSHLLGYGHSRNTFLTLLARMPLPEIVTPRILGVDDFAWRKGHHYGTILVDLETHQPIALLPDRKAETLAAWLIAHPGVEILSRDRSKAYKSGMDMGAPDAIQVADRFHLLKNLQETLEDSFRGQAKVFERIERSQLEAVGVRLPDSEEPTTPTPPSPAQQKKAEKRALRLERYEQVHALRNQGYKIKDIAHHLGMGVRTVETYLSHDSFPEWKSSSRKHSSRSMLDPYKPFLMEQWTQGHRVIKRLFEQVDGHGYPGTYKTLTRYIKFHPEWFPPSAPSPESLNALPGRGPAPKGKPVSNHKSLNAGQAAWLVLQRPETLDERQGKLLEQLSQQPELAEALQLTQGFLKLVRERLPEQLDTWLTQAKDSAVKGFQRFAKGLNDDYDAVKAGVTLEVSNGQVEGQNNRLKMLKRQMFGRAGLALLEKRLILNSRPLQLQRSQEPLLALTKT